MAKERVSLEELQARDDAYGHTLNTNKMIKIMAPYVLAMGAFAYILFVNLMFTGIVMVLAGIYSYLNVLPNEISVRYYRTAYEQRNQLISSFNQYLSNPSITLKYDLYQSSLHLRGEFRSDMLSLCALVYDTTNVKERHIAFQKIEDKYKDDTLFREFLEQVENSLIRDTKSKDTFHDITVNHDKMFQIQKEWINIRAKHRKNFFVLIAFVLALVLSIAFSSQGYSPQSFHNWAITYAHSWIGIGFSIVFLICLTFITNGFFKLYYDEDLNFI